LLPGAEIVRTGRHVICQSAHLFVADECAGLRSLKTMVVVGMFISFWQRNTIICCFLIPVISAILAFMGNILRICFVFWAVIFWGPALEIGSWHAWSGNIVLAVEIILIWKIAEKISVTKYRVYRDPAADKVIISGE
jgi:exosortase